MARTEGTKRKRASRQFMAAWRTYETHKKRIERDIVRIAEDVVTRRVDLTSPEAYNLIFNDGVFTPWLDAPGGAYEKIMSELGNDDDDVTYISDTWIAVLRKANAKRYAAIIDKLEEIEATGL